MQYKITSSTFVLQTEPSHEKIFKSTPSASISAQTSYKHRKNSRLARPVFVRNGPYIFTRSRPLLFFFSSSPLTLLSKTVCIIYCPFLKNLILIIDNKLIPMLMSNKFRWTRPHHGVTSRLSPHVLLPAKPRKLYTIDYWLQKNNQQEVSKYILKTILHIFSTVLTKNILNSVD